MMERDNIVDEDLERETEKYMEEEDSDWDSSLNGKDKATLDWKDGYNSLLDFDFYNWDYD